METLLKYPLKTLLEQTHALLATDFLLSAVCIGIIIYLTALIVSKMTSCIILSRWFDVVITAIPGIIFGFLLYEYGNDKTNAELFLNNIWLNILFLLSFLGALFLSLFLNIKYCSFPVSLIFVVISIMAKLLIMILIPVFIVLFFGAMNYGKKDKRYKSGRQGNKNIIAMAIVAGLAYILVNGLIKKNIIKETET